MIETYVKLIFLILLFVGCGYAAVRGGAPERWGAGLYFLAVVMTNVAHYFSSMGYLRADPGIVVVDLALAVGLIVLAIRAQRYWPMWIAAIQVDAVLTHFLMFSKTTGPLAYALVLAAWSLPIPAMIGVGAWRHRQRVIRWGDDPAWA